MPSLVLDPPTADAAPHYRLWRPLLAMATVVFAYRLGWLLSHDYSLFVDEAQYWQWARHPAFGYYSKPPLVAWLIAASTALLGNAEWTVRLSALLAWPVTGVLVGLLAARLGGQRAGLASAALFMTMPGQALSGWVVSPDAFLLLAWAGALLALHGALRGKAGIGPWLALGLALGLGALAKYSMLMFLPGLFWVLAGPAHRHHWHKAGPWLALALLLACLAPNLWWNLQSGFETVRHTAELAQTSESGWLHPQHLAEFLAAQWLIFGLLAFPLLLPRLRDGDDATRFLRPFILPYLLAMTLLAFFANANPNWAAAAYVAASVLLGQWLARPERRRWLAASLALNLLLGLAVMHYRDIAGWTGIDIPKRDLHSRVDGWRELGQTLQPIFEREGSPPVLAADRHLLSQLGYYLRPAPWPVAALDLDGRISHQYELDTARQGLPARAIWVAPANTPLPSELSIHYQELRELGETGDPRGLRRLRLVLVSDLREGQP